jgi:hypothetical protein
MSISVCVRDCLEAFRIDYDEDSNLQDESGRFKVWVGNIAAHRPAHSRRSLEHRLRDSSRLRDMVLSLLVDLKTALDDLKALVLPPMTGDLLANQGITTALHQEANTKARQDYIHPDHEDEDSFELSDEESVDEGTPVSEAISEIHDVVTCLLRFSMTLRSPGRGDQRKNDPGNLAEAFVAHDTEHVRAKFPEAPDYLVRRLGKTLSKHRQYFRYRREHQAKLLEGLDDGETAAWEMPSTIATSLPDDPLSTRNPSHLPNDAETESNYTATSYEGTLTGDANLRVPRWPVSAQTGSPFECPICFGIVVAETELSWKRHVFEDIPPYVCMSEDCGAAIKSFSRRRDWKLHNDGMHTRVWVCPYGCVEPMRSPDTFRSHIETAHIRSVPGDFTQTLVAACGRTIEMPSIRICPLCSEMCPSAKHWTKHVGHHLEQLALFSLPMELFAIDASDGSDGHSSTEEQHPGHALSDVEPDSLARAVEQTGDGDNLLLRTKVAMDSDSGAASSASAASMRPPSPAMPEPSLRELHMEDEYKALGAQIQLQAAELIALENDIEDVDLKNKLQEAKLLYGEYAAKKAKEESDKKLAEAEAAKVELEEKQKELEEAVAENARIPVPDMQEAWIKFSDAASWMAD